jgi:hypothetical protein
MPRVYLTSTAAPNYTHEPFEVRVAGIVYTCVVNSTADVLVPVEHMTPFTTAVAAADSNITVNTRPE